MVRSGVRVAGSVAVSLARFVSPPPDTVTEFVRVPEAVEANVPVTVMGLKLPLTATTAVLVQVGSVVQVQPVPAIAVMVNPVGGVSTTVVVPDVAPVPTLLGVTV